MFEEINVCDVYSITFSAQRNTKPFKDDRDKNPQFHN